jgi:hypothetical protein
MARVMFTAPTNASDGVPINCARLCNPEPKRPGEHQCAHLIRRLVGTDGSCAKGALYECGRPWLPSPHRLDVDIHAWQRTSGYATGNPHCPRALETATKWPATLADLSSTFERDASRSRDARYTPGLGR